MIDEDKMLIKYANIISEYCKNTKCDKCIIHNKVTEDTYAIKTGCPLTIICSMNWDKILNENYEVTNPEDKMIVKYMITLCRNCRVDCKGGCQYNEHRECVFNTNPIDCPLDHEPKTWNIKEVIKYNEEKENGQ